MTVFISTLDLLWGIPDEVPLLPGLDPIVKKDCWLMMTNHSALSYFVGLTDGKWMLYPERFDPSKVSRTNPLGHYIDTDNPLIIPKEDYSTQKGTDCAK